MNWIAACKNSSHVLSRRATKTIKKKGLLFFLPLYSIIFLALVIPFSFASFSWFKSRLETPQWIHPHRFLHHCPTPPSKAKPSSPFPPPPEFISLSSFLQFPVELPYIVSLSLSLTLLLSDVRLHFSIPSPQIRFFFLYL